MKADYGFKMDLIWDDEVFEFGTCWNFKGGKFGEGTNAIVYDIADEGKLLCVSTAVQEEEISISEFMRDKMEFRKLS